jgi:hypothetical protein
MLSRIARSSATKLARAATWSTKSAMALARPMHASVSATMSKRTVPLRMLSTEADNEPSPTVRVEETLAGVSPFQNLVTSKGHHVLISDEPVGFHGAMDTGPSPYDLLLAAVGTCTSSKSILLL